MPSFDAFYENLLLRGLENFRKYYGIYRGTVTRNDDPEMRGRVQAKVLQVGHTNTPDIWIDPAFEGAGENRGSFFPPEVGDSVRVAFEAGRADKPIIYFGGWYGGTDLPEEFSYTTGQRINGQTGSVPVPERRGIITRKGHRLIFNDEDGKETVTLAWHQPSASDAAKTADKNGDRSKTADRGSGKTSTLVMNSDGDVVVTNANGSSVTLSSKNKNIVVQDENSNVLTMDSNGVTLKTKKAVIKATQVEVGDGADTPGVRGRELNTWLTSHTHGTAWGPSSPPLTPPPATILSKNVKLK